ncbi:MAG: glycosyltransferase, partial [Bacteroidales bacterium]
MLPIILLNWNGSDDTIHCIKSLEQQTFQDFHIYLIDNNSCQQEKDTLLNYCKDNRKITLILNEENLGFGKAHNQVFQQYIFPKDYTYVFLLNNDTEVERSCLENLMLFAEEFEPD